MIQRSELTEIYIEQYETASRKRLRNPGRTQGYMERINALIKTMRRTKEERVTTGILTDYHRQIKNLTYHAFRSRNPKAVKRVREELLPELVRLDLAVFLPEQRESMREEFLDYLNNEVKGEICLTSLFELYQPFVQHFLQVKIVELVPSRPELEFPEVLEMRRHFVLHIGPTNSGKTFQALERLKEAGTGVYLGPLRLLALEVYERMMEYGVPCTMLTGQECIAEPDSRITASTVEMADFEKIYDVAVIDEAQMTADSERGHCWTRAILGLQAREIHICMSPIAEEVVEHLISLCGDDYEIHRYERKTALVCEDTSFSFPEDVQPGDALVVFSKKSVLDVAGRLEEKGIPASVIYGSLPPEIRRRQMQLFTSGQTKVVVATDAIGMGLNLPVRRIVFIETEKFDGRGRRGLTVQEIKQIAGRSGRFGIYDTGYVNAMGEESLEYVRERYDAKEDPVTKVSLGFPQILLDLQEPLDVILNVWHSVRPSPLFEKISIEEILILYEYARNRREWIDGYDDKHILYKMISCPIDVKDKDVVNQWLEYCENYSADKYLEHPSMENEPQYRRGRRVDKGGIRRYETYYKKLDLYYQFSRRFDKEIDEEWLEGERSYTERRIMQYLTKGKQTYIARCQYCGRLLPVDYHLSKCPDCLKRMESGRGRLFGGRGQGGRNQGGRRFGKSGSGGSGRASGRLKSRSGGSGRSVRSGHSGDSGARQQG